MNSPTKISVNVRELEDDTLGRYKFERFLGRGSFGTVFAAIDKQTGQNVAIKRIEDVFESDLNAKRILREVLLLSQLHHENITNFIDLYARRDMRVIYLVIDLMDTDLSQLIHTKQRLVLDHHRYFLYQILKALKYLHSANVVHLDIKPGNLFVNGKSELKIGDFGLAKIIGDPYDPELQNEVVLTRYYRAPEVLLNMKIYGPAIDIWSTGCVLAELMMGRPLFPGQSNANMLTLIVELLGNPTNTDLRQIMNNSARIFMDSLPQKHKIPFDQYFKGCDNLEIDLLEKMLTWDPEKRITIEQALNHPFISQMHDAFDEPVTLPFQNFDFDTQSLSLADLRRKLWIEVIKRHRELA